MGCLLIVILALFGGVGFLMPAATTTAPVVQVIPTTLPTPTVAPAQLGAFTAARSIDADGCPVDPSTTFTEVAQFYVVIEESTIPAGTRMFVRLVQDERPLEDTPPITADRDYANTCVYFEFSSNAGAFEAGDYEAILFVNGSEAGRVAITIE